MLVPKLKSKIHSAIVTDANKDYEGSITICADLMRKAEINEFDMVHVNCKDTGVHWETYAIAGEKDEICLNGAAAHHFNIGDDVHILTYCYVENRELYVIPIII